MPKKTLNMKKFPERRGGVRANRVVAVKHRLLKRDGRKKDSIWSLSSTKNMSFSGLLFMSPVPYEKGDVLDLEIVMSGMIDIYNGQAEVVRVHESSAQSYDVAVRYIEAKTKKRPAKSHLKK